MIFFWCTVISMVVFGLVGNIYGFTVMYKYPILFLSHSYVAWCLGNSLPGTKLVRVSGFPPETHRSISPYTTFAINHTSSWIINEKNEKIETIIN